MDCTLHIGTEKTGTTSIQSFLNLNREILKGDARILYPHSSGIENSRGFSYLGYEPDQVDDYTIHQYLVTKDLRLAHQEKMFADIKKEIDLNRSRVDKVIFSSEHLQSRLSNEERLVRLKGAIERLDLNVSNVILYIRNPIETAISLYSTVLKGGTITDGIYHPGNKHIQTICDHKRTILLWGSIFGEGNLTIRLYRQDLMYENDLLSDFMNAMRLPHLNGLKSPPPENLSLDSNGVEILKRINQKIPNFINGKPNLIRKDIGGFVARYFSSGEKIKPSNELITEYEDFFAESNKWVQENYFPHIFPLFPKLQPNNLNSKNVPDISRVADLMADIWIAKEAEMSRLKMNYSILKNGGSIK